MNDSTVIVRLQSLGLGNSFFQYATARSVASRTGARVLFDISGSIPPQLGLGGARVGNEAVRQLFAPYKMDFDFASLAQIVAARGLPYQTGRLRRKLNRGLDLLGMRPRAYFREKKIHQFDQEVLGLTAPVYLEGTFINPRYFGPLARDILREVTASARLPDPLFALSQTMKQTNSVSVHIRRGDFTTAATGNIYPLYGPDYARKALELIRERSGVDHCYVFSDDITWAQQNVLLGDDTTYVSLETQHPWEDLELMRSCKHHIIANSTFSWWGAFNPDSPESIVVCPKKWRNDDIDVSDMILPGWIAI
ncbi:MAG TPA: alpha-1,2-fucosyltransferase [Ensifer sp.]|nr:alpha-1,2-fucosyltransferase [Ensifer sp.]